MFEAVIEAKEEKEMIKEEFREFNPDKKEFLNKS
jgi:hypothetical protein